MSATNQNACKAFWSQDTQKACDAFPTDETPECCNGDGDTDLTVLCYTQCTQDCSAYTQAYADIWFGSDTFPDVSTCGGGNPPATQEQAIACSLISAHNQEAAYLNQTTASGANELVSALMSVLNARNCVADAFNEASGLKKGAPNYAAKIDVDAVQEAIYDAVKDNATPTERKTEKLFMYIAIAIVVYVIFKAMTKPKEP